MPDPGYYLDPQNWTMDMSSSPLSSNIEDRRGDQRLPPLDQVWGDMMRNNIMSRWWRGGQYAGPGYEYLPRESVDMSDPMAMALGADQIPVTSYGTTHPLKRYNPDYNSNLRR